jgi:transglutaminase-like putative cysteine protease
VRVFAGSDLSDLGGVPLHTVHSLLLTLALAVAPHFIHLPLIITIPCATFALWRLLAAQRAWPLPGKTSRVILTLAAMSGVFVSYGTIFGRDAGTALLTVMLGLKLLEVKTRRDAMIVLILSYFLAVTTVLYSQEIPVIAYLLAVIVIATATVIELHHPRVQRRTASLRLAMNLTMQSLPLMAAMFLLFPRIPGPLWGLSNEGHGGVQGLDDSMTPGSISHLGQSEEVAFRARFVDRLPPPQQLYWRGPILWDFDGRSWHGGQGMDTGQGALIHLHGKAVTYTVTLEPHNRRWLYALDLPSTTPAEARRWSDGELVATEPVQQLKWYTTTSYPEARLATLSAGDRMRALRLPSNGNPRARALAAQWRAGVRDDSELVERALQYFHDQAFFYTLEPPPLGRDSVDDFLFNTRRGFCEHYSAAFTFLMRVAGIPTRIVTGYQGGELNTLGDYLIVRQRDAHAWAEVWSAGEGWHRIDPTAAVAPERITRGIDSSLGDVNEGIMAGFATGPFGAMWQRVRLGWDVLDNGWNQWVLGYGPSNQSTLLERFGLVGWKGMTAGLIIAVATLFFAGGVILLFSRRRVADPVRNLYRLYCRALERRGIRRIPAEGPIAFADRVAAIRPDIAPQSHTICTLYATLRYGPATDAALLRQLRTAVRAFKP